MNQGDGNMKFSNGWFWSWKCGFVTFFSYLYYFSRATFEDFLPGGVRSYQEHVGAHARRGRPSCRCEHGCICWCECSQTASAYLCWRTEVHTFVIYFFNLFPKGSTPTSSATVYVLADRIQHEFEDNISKLLEDIITPVLKSLHTFFVIYSMGNHLHVCA